MLAPTHCDARVSVSMDDVSLDQRSGAVKVKGNPIPRVAGNDVADDERALDLPKSVSVRDHDAIVPVALDLIASDFRIWRATPHGNARAAIAHSYGIPNSDEVAHDPVIAGRCAHGCANSHSSVLVTTDDIALGGFLSTDDIVAGANTNSYTFTVGNSNDTTGISANIVAANSVVRGIVFDPHPKDIVAADEVTFATASRARRGIASTDNVVAGPTADVGPIAGVADGDRPADIRADVVAANHIVHRAVGPNPHTVTLVTTNDVAFGQGCSAYPVILGAMIERHPASPTIAKGSRAADIRTDQVAHNSITHGSSVVDDHAILTIATDQIQFARRCAPNHVVLSATLNADAISGTQSVGTRCIRTDVVTADNVVVCSKSMKPHLGGVHLVATNEVALTCSVAADQVVAGAITDADAVAVIGDGGCTAGIGANVVAADGVAHGASSIYANAILVIAADEILLSSRRPAYAVLLRSPIDRYTTVSIAQGHCAVNVGANKVANDDVAYSVNVFDSDTRTIVVGTDSIPLPRHCPPYDVPLST